MSYILEALKKSERERGHGSAPGIQSVHSSGIRYNTVRRPLWPYILTAAVVINLSVLIYFVLEDGSPTPVRDGHSDRVASAPVEQDTPSRAETPPAATAQAQTQDEETALESPDRIKATSHPAPARQVTEAIQPVATDTGTNTPAVGQESLAYTQAYTPQRNELPVEIERQIPIMEFSAHVYSNNPAQRSIMINGRFLEEGDRLASDLVLSEITPQGAIFDFRGHRFQQAVVAAWN